MTFYQRAYIGAWTNAETGTWILTLRDREAGFLSAALVIFVTTVSGQAWKILSFFLHQIRASKNNDYRYYVYRQQAQAILRNSASHSHAAWLAARVTLGWSRHLGFLRSLRLSLPVLLVSLGSLGIWSPAQLLTSKIWSTAGDQFLLTNAACVYQGFPDADEPHVMQRSTMWLNYWRNRLEAASTYERECYSADADSRDCLTLPVRRLKWTMQDTSCPFQDTTLCLRTNNTPALLDTGYINSNTHLGLNTLIRDAVEYRKTAACSPMQTDRRRSYFSNTTFFCIEEPCAATELIVVEYDYGPHTSGTNATFALSIYPTEIYNTGYKVVSLSSPIQYLPHRDITTRSDVHTSIFFRTDEDMFYYQPTDDPWFYTTRQPVIETLYQGKVVQMWQPIEHYLPSILGCIEEQEFCNPVDGRCKHFNHDTNLTELYASLAYSRGQMASATRIVDSASVGSNLGFMVKMLADGDAVLASNTMWEGSQMAQLHVTQWKSEVGRWFSLSLILLQMGLIEDVTGPKDPELKRSWVLRNHTDLIRSCERQRFSNAVNARNFNLSAIIAVLLAGSVIIILGFTIDTLVGFIQSIFRPTARGRYEWIMDGLFQQQRLAYQAAGVEPWYDVDTVLPVSVPRNGTQEGKTNIRAYERVNGKRPIDG